MDDVFEVEAAEGGDSSDVGSENEGASKSDASIAEIASDQTCIAYSRSLLQVLTEIQVGKCIVQACRSAPKINII